MTIRRATESDEGVLRELWTEFEREVPEPFGEGEPWESEWSDTLDDIRGGGVFIAEDAEGPLGVARVEAPDRGRSNVQLVYVRSRGRRQGVAKALLAYYKLGATSLLIRGYEPLGDAEQYGAELIPLVRRLVAETDAREILGSAERSAASSPRQ